MEAGFTPAFLLSIN